MVVFNLITNTSELQIAAQIYDAVFKDVCARVSGANYSDDEIEHVPDGEIIAASLDEINEIAFKVGQMLIIQSGNGGISTGGEPFE